MESQIIDLRHLVFIQKKTWTHLLCYQIHLNISLCRQTKDQLLSDQLCHSLLLMLVQEIIDPVTHLEVILEDIIALMAPPQTSLRGLEAQTFNKKLFTKKKERPSMKYVINCTNKLTLTKFRAKLGVNRFYSQLRLTYATLCRRLRRKISCRLFIRIIFPVDFKKFHLHQT